jgi:hypothetical protein
MYKYKYKYKYGFMDTETRSGTLLNERSGFTSQLTPPPIEGIGRPDLGFGNFYTEKDGKGNFFTIYPGQQSPNLGEWAKKIASVYITGPIKVILYEKINFEGEKLDELPHDKYINLDNYVLVCIGPGCQFWDTSVASIRVEPLK